MTGFGEMLEAEAQARLGIGYIQGNRFAAHAEQREAKRAYRDFLKVQIAELPNPPMMLACLSVDELAVLRSAWKTQAPGNEGCWRVRDEDAPLLQKCGLVGVGCPFLTAFGMNVLRRLMELEG